MLLQITPEFLNALVPFLPAFVELARIWANRSRR